MPTPRRSREPSREPAPPPPPRGVRRLLPFALLAAAAVLVFANTLENGLHLDDFYRIGDWTQGAGNPELERVNPVWRHFVDPGTSTTLPTLAQYRPLLPLSLSLSHALSDAMGLDRLVGLHLGNLAIHVAGAWFLYLLFAELLARARDRGRDRASGTSAGGAPGGSERRVALVAALVFAVHPVSGVPVNYLCARDLLLMQALSSAGLWAYVRMRRRGDSAAGWLAALGLVALSLLAKTNSLVVPLVVLAYEGLLEPGGLRRAGAWLRAAPFAAVSSGFYLWTEVVLGFSDKGQLLIDRPAWEYPLTQAREHLTHYLRNAVAPFWLRPLPRVDPVGSGSGELGRALADPWLWCGAAVIVLGLVLAWRWRRSRPLASFCILAYWIWMALTSSVLPLRSLATDYRQVPSLPFLVLLVALLARERLPRRWRAPLAAAAVLAFGLVSALHHNPIWRTERTLWARSVGVGTGGTSRAHMNYGQSLTGTEPVLAEHHLRVALELAPGDVYSHINLGLLLLRRGRPEEGLASARRAVELAPGWAIARYWLGRAHEELGQREAAAAEYGHAADLQPDHPRYLHAAARSAQWSGSTGGFERSLALVERLHGIAGPMEDSLFLEGYARQKLGQRARAVEAYRAFLERHPDHAQALFNLAYALMEEGEPREAARLFERCLDVDPSRNEVHHWLARTYEALGDAERAAEERAAYAAGRR